MTAALRGALGYRAGLAAEASVAAHYLRAGLSLAAERWRGAGGELDLVFRDGAGLVFVEVKKSRDFACAARRVTQRQIGRILSAAAEYLGGEPRGQDTDVRFDVALVNAQGEIQVLENALSA